MKGFSRGLFQVKPPKGVDVTKIKPASAPPSRPLASIDSFKGTSEADNVALPLPPEPLMKEYEAALRSTHGLNHDEKLKLAQQEVDDAELMIKGYEERAVEYRKLLAFRRDNLERLKQEKL
jgi:hypothetical protein